MGISIYPEYTDMLFDLPPRSSRTGDMKTRKIKIEEHLSMDAAATLLRAIADAIEHDDHDALETFGIDHIHESKKIKIDLRKEAEQISLHLKIKYRKNERLAHTNEHETEMPSLLKRKPAYKTLKKRMKADFASITASIKGNSLPSQTVIDAFLKDSELMVSYRGYGDEYYGAYTHDCNRLRKAFDSSDVSSCMEALHALSERMRECHKRYKK